MRMNPALMGAVACLGAFCGEASAGVVFTTSEPTFASNAGAHVVNTMTTGQYDPTNPFATVSTANLANGVIGLSDSSTVVEQPQSGFPFALANGFSGDLFLPSGASITLTPPSQFTALGFYVATYSAGLTAPQFQLTFTSDKGQSVTESITGADYTSFTSPVAFFGYYGGPVGSLTITSNDPNGFVIGDFSSVATAAPEPETIWLLVAGGLGVMTKFRRRRRA